MTKFLPVGYVGKWCTPLPGLTPPKTSPSVLSPSAVWMQMTLGGPRRWWGRKMGISFEPVNNIQPKTRVGPSAHFWNTLSTALSFLVLCLGLPNSPAPFQCRDISRLHLASLQAVYWYTCCPHLTCFSACPFFYCLTSKGLQNQFHHSTPCFSCF